MEAIRKRNRGSSSVNKEYLEFLAYKKRRKKAKPKGSFIDTTIASVDFSEGEDHGGDTKQESTMHVRKTKRIENNVFNTGKGKREHEGSVTSNDSMDEPTGDESEQEHKADGYDANSAAGKRATGKDYDEDHQDNNVDTGDGDSKIAASRNKKKKRKHPKKATKVQRTYPLYVFESFIPSPTTRSLTCCGLVQ